MTYLGVQLVETNVRFKFHAYEDFWGMYLNQCAFIYILRSVMWGEQCTVEVNQVLLLTYITILSILLTVKTCLEGLKIQGNFKNRLLNMWIFFNYFEVFLAGKLSKYTTLNFCSIEVASFSWYLPPTMAHVEILGNSQNDQFS